MCKDRCYRRGLYILLTRRRSGYIYITQGRDSNCLQLYSEKIALAESPISTNSKVPNADRPDRRYGFAVPRYNAIPTARNNYEKPLQRVSVEYDAGMLA